MEQVVAVLLCVLSLSAAQDCPLPNNTQIETAMRGLPTGGDDILLLDPTILEPVHFVCLAQGSMINTYKTLSVIATYTPRPGQSTTTNIFQLICSNGVWTADTSGQPVAPDPSVRNITRYDCVQCRHSNGPDRCRACNSACNTGLRRCTGTSSSDCCSYFDRNGQCTNENCTVSSGDNYIATASNNFTCTCNLTCPPGHIVNTTSCNECIFTSICDRDSPCHNGGNCIQYSPATNYTCDCTGTGYKGVNCTELIPSPSPSIVATTSSSTPTPSLVCSILNCDSCDTSNCCKTCSAGFYLNPDGCFCGNICEASNPCGTADCSAGSLPNQYTCYCSAANRSNNGGFSVLSAVLSVMVIACIVVIIILSVVLIKTRQRKKQSYNYAVVVPRTSDPVTQANLAYDTVK